MSKKRRTRIGSTSKHDLKSVEKPKCRHIEIYSVLILVATLFMSIGYAQITGIALDITGEINAKPQDGVFITDMVPVVDDCDADLENSNVNYFYGTLADTKIVLNQDENSKFTYAVTVYNKSSDDYVFIDTITDLTEETFYSNENIKFELIGIEQYKTIIKPGEFFNFKVVFSFKVDADINQNILESKLNYRFRIKPIITLNNEGQSNTIKNVAPEYEPKEYEFIVSNYNDTKINNVPMTYYFEHNLPKPFTLKIYDEDKNEVDVVKLVGDGITKVDQVYTYKVIWDDTNPEEDKKYNDSEYLEKDFGALVTLIAMPDDDKYLEYRKQKSFELKLELLKEFYFNVEASKTKLYYDNGFVNFDLVVNNNDGANYNLYETKYKIRLANNEKFNIYVDGIESDTNGYVFEMEGNKKVTQEITIKISGKDGIDFNLVEEYVEVVVETIEPYNQEIIIPVTIIRDLAINPIVDSNVKRIKYENGNWKEADTTKPEDWFDYREQRWANVETENGYYVYIPRYAYKITSGYHTSLTGSGTIAIVFLNKDNTLKTEIDSEGNKVSQSDIISPDKVDSSISGSGLNATTKYIIHPAFVSLDTNESNVDGIWISKYEMSMESTSDGGSTWNSVTISNETAGNISIVSSTTKKMVSKPGVNSWRYITASNMFNNSYYMNRNLDSHMAKNTEWGAAVYLACSSYGIGKDNEVQANTSTMITGYGSGTTLNPGEASTTGNITGIYDMAGGSYEYVAGYLEDVCAASGGAVYSLIENLVNAESRYKDVYSIRYFANGSTSNTYADTTIANALKVGDALWEVSGDSATTAWFNDEFYFAGYSSGGHYPIFDRGGCYSNSANAVGITYTGRNTGEAHPLVGFRTVICMK